MTERDFDIWLHGFARATRETPALAISRVFRIPVPAAEALVATLPRVVKRDASADQAERLVHALEAIGGVAEAIPTRVVPAPVLVVGTQPIRRPETLVRHAPRADAQRAHPILDSPAGGGETLKLGTHELAAYREGGVLPAQLFDGTGAHDVPLGGAIATRPVASPDDTLVDPIPPRFDAPAPAAVALAFEAAPAPEVAPPRWASLQHDSAHPTALQGSADARGHWDDIELAPPEQLPPISLAPPPVKNDLLGNTASNVELHRDPHEWLEKVAQQSVPLTPLSSRPPPASDTSWITLTPHPAGQLTSGSPPAWRNPMALPPRDEALRSLGMRTAQERMRLGRQRSQHPPSIAPRAPTEDPNTIDALNLLGRGDLEGAARASPSLMFALILVGVTLAFSIAYAAL